MILDASIRLEAVLAGAPATSQPEVTVDYIEWNVEGWSTRPATFRVALNSTTDVVILPAPTRNPVREPLRVSIYNKDTASITVTVKTDVAAGGGTEYIEIKQSITTLRSIVWEKTTGWYVI